MNYYSIALFFHVVGALGIFVAFGLEWTGLRQVQIATTSEQVRASIRIPKSARRVGIASMLTILVTGFYMMATVWGGAAWIIVALGALVLMIVLAAALTGPRMAAIERILTAEHGQEFRNIQRLANHTLLCISIRTRVAVALGIVFLMTVKPDQRGALLAIVVAALFGIAASLPLTRRERVQQG
jgi:D-alanyl-lipoteichoic acid acyltransferase DltB (MBOAT superfamily)